MRYKEIIILELENALKETKYLRLYKWYSLVLKHFQGFRKRDIITMKCLIEHIVALKRLNLRYIRPEYVLKNADPIK